MPTDHGPRPRSRSIRRGRGRRRDRAQAVEVERPADAQQRRAAPGVQSERAEPCGREGGERLGRRRRVEPRPADGGHRRADDPPLDRAGVPGEDQLAAERAQQRLGDRRRPDRPQAGQVPRRRPDQRVAPEAAQELGVVGVEGEAEAELLEPLLARRPQDDDPVGPLPGLRRARGRRRPRPPR